MRSSETKKANNKVLILTNGENSEVNYFELLKKKTKSPYSIKVKFENGDPLYLVQKAVDEVKKNNHIWCVFDIDKFHEEGKVEPAYTLADKYNNISIACSNEAFEVWLLNHFEEFITKMSRTKYGNEIERLIKKNYKNNIEYDKSDSKLLENYFIPNLSTGIKNSKKTLQSQIVQFKNDNNTINDPNIWELYSVTTVYKLIEFLKIIVRKKCN